MHASIHSFVLQQIHINYLQCVKPRTTEIQSLEKTPGSTVYHLCFVVCGKGSWELDIFPVFLPPVLVFLPENAMDRETWRATVHGVARAGHDLVTKPPPPAHSIPLLHTLVKVHPSLVFSSTSCLKENLSCLRLGHILRTLSLS